MKLQLHNKDLMILLMVFMMPSIKFTLITWQEIKQFSNWSNRLILLSSKPVEKEMRKPKPSKKLKLLLQETLLLAFRLKTPMLRDLPNNTKLKSELFKTNSSLQRRFLVLS
jgi:hypothetical protein